MYVWYACVYLGLARHTYVGTSQTKHIHVFNTELSEICTSKMSYLKILSFSKLFLGTCWNR